jgi:hypothetical protein
MRENSFGCAVSHRKLMSHDRIKSAGIGMDHRCERADWELSGPDRAAIRPALARAGAHARGF